jgi:hypothetical protein
MLAREQQGLPGSRASSVFGTPSRPISEPVPQERSITPLQSFSLSSKATALSREAQRPLPSELHRRAPPLGPEDESFLAPVNVSPQRRTKQ